MMDIYQRLSVDEVIRELEQDTQETILHTRLVGFVVDDVRLAQQYVLQKITTQTEPEDFLHLGMLVYDLQSELQYETIREGPRNFVLDQLRLGCYESANIIQQSNQILTTYIRVSRVTNKEQITQTKKFLERMDKVLTNK